MSNNIRLAIKLDLDGAYIPAFNKSFSHNSYNLKKKFKLIGSAHNLEEIRIKEKQGVDIIFISPIFKVNKSSNFLGLNKFNILSKFTQKKVVALGGINEKNIKKLKLINCNGYASITYLKNRKELNDLRK